MRLVVYTVYTLSHFPHRKPTGLLGKLSKLDFQFGFRPQGEFQKERRKGNPERFISKSENFVLRLDLSVMTKKNLFTNSVKNDGNDFRLKYNINFPDKYVVIVLERLRQLHRFLNDNSADGVRKRCIFLTVSDLKANRI